MSLALKNLGSLRTATIAVAIVLTMFASMIRPAPAAADTNTTRNIILGALGVTAIILYDNWQHKRAYANSVVGYTQDGGTVYGDGRIVYPDGTTIYTSNNGSTICTFDGYGRQCQPYNLSGYYPSGTYPNNGYYPYNPNGYYPNNPNGYYPNNPYGYSPNNNSEPDGDEAPNAPYPYTYYPNSNGQRVYYVPQNAARRYVVRNGRYYYYYTQNGNRGRHRGRGHSGDNEDRGDRGDDGNGD